MSAIGDVTGASFGTACEFIAALAEAGVETTVTAVASPDASPAAVRDLGHALGAVAYKERTFLESGRAHRVGHRHDAFDAPK